MEKKVSLLQKIIAFIFNPNLWIVGVLIAVNTGFFATINEFDLFFIQLFELRTKNLEELQSLLIDIPQNIINIVIAVIIFMNIIGLVYQILKKPLIFFKARLFLVNKVLTIPVIVVLIILASYNFSAFTKVAIETLSKYEVYGIIEIDYSDIEEIEENPKNMIIFATKEGTTQNEEIEKYLYEFSEENEINIYMFDVINIEEDQKNTLLKYNITNETAPRVMVLKYGAIDSVFNYDTIIIENEFEIEILDLIEDEYLFN